MGPRVGRQVGRWVGPRVGRQVGWQAGSPGGSAGRVVGDPPGNKQTDKQTDRQTRTPSGGPFPNAPRDQNTLLGHPLTLIFPCYGRAGLLDFLRFIFSFLPSYSHSSPSSDYTPPLPRSSLPTRTPLAFSTSIASCCFLLLHPRSSFSIRTLLTSSTYIAFCCLLLLPPAVLFRPAPP